MHIAWLVWSVACLWLIYAIGRRPYWQATGFWWIMLMYFATLVLICLTSLLP